jgi:GxxExxY protein
LAKRKEPQMNADSRSFMHESLSRTVIRLFFGVYNELGHGFIESVYERSLAIAFDEAGIAYVRQAPVAVWFRGESVGEFRADFIVDGVIILELKAVRTLDDSHEAQLLNYLRATNVEVGYLLNFGLRPTFKRLVFSNDRKRPADERGGSR